MSGRRDSSSSSQLIPDNADISVDLIQALATKDINPDDIEIVTDETSGRSVVRVKTGRTLASRRSSVSMATTEGGAVVMVTGGQRSRVTGSGAGSELHFHMEQK